MGELVLRDYICILIILLSIFISLRKVARTNDISQVIEPIISGCSTVVTFFIILYKFEYFDTMVGNFLSVVFKNSIKDNGLVHIAGLVAIFGLIKFIIYMLLKLVHSFSLNSSIRKIRYNKPLLFSLSALFGFIRGLIAVVILCIPLVLYNNLVDSGKRIDLLDGLKAYDKMEELVDAKKVQVISNGLKENISSNKIIYYNGVTLDEGVKSNDDIDNKAKSIVARYSTDREKARSIYRWVGSNISYDDNKADSIMDQNSGYESGAIPTYRDKSGICFDYACLFTAMCSATDIKSRIIVGEAYNGEEYISHAWNQVYLEDEGKWVNVDPTFYIAGDYFDSAEFNETHKAKNIAGEFN